MILPSTQSGRPRGGIQIKKILRIKSPKQQQQRGGGGGRGEEIHKGLCMRFLFTNLLSLMAKKKKEKKTVYISVKEFWKNCEAVIQWNKNKTAKMRDLDLYVSRWTGVEKQE